MGSEGSGLLIFSERGYESPQPKAARKLKIQMPSSKSDMQNEVTSPASANTAAQPDIRKLYCTNHPWRQAYAICDKCRLPYCYVDMISYNNKMYCLQDIDFATKQHGLEHEEMGTNSFSVLASMLFLVNSMLLLYFTYPQAIFLLSNAANKGITGAISFFLNFNPQYFAPFANTLIIILGFISAITILRKSVVSFGVSFFVAFISLFIVSYEYLNSSVTYLLLSSLMLLIAISLTLYSRMSAIGQHSEENYNVLPSVEWPKPEAF